MAVETSNGKHTHRGKYKPYYLSLQIEYNYTHTHQNQNNKLTNKTTKITHTTTGAHVALSLVKYLARNLH